MSGTSGALRLIELTSTRLCHDISGLIGSLDGAAGPPAGGVPVAATERPVPGTAEVLTARIELRRAAWGPDGDPMPLAQLERLAAGLPEQVMVDLSALDPSIMFAASTGRIVLNLLLLATESLPSGGSVVVAGEARDLFFRIAGPAAAWPVGMAVCLSDEAAARAALIDGGNLQMPLTALLAHAAGIRLSVALSPVAGNEPAILRLSG